MPQDESKTTKSKIAKRLSDKAKKLREIHNLSLDEAAKRIGITKSHLWDFEQGNSRNPTLKMIEGLATGYGVSIADLIGEEKLSDMRLSPFALKIATMIDNAMKGEA